MGYYTTLKLKADFNNSENFKELRKFADWYNALDYDEYMENYYYVKDWNKFIEENNFFIELKEFLFDCRSQTVLTEFVFYSMDEITNLSIYCEIKNYTHTYEKLYNLLLACNPEDILIEERGEEMKTPNIYKLKNNKLIKIQSGESDV